jgi:hypothetical protein
MPRSVRLGRTLAWLFLAFLFRFGNDVLDCADAFPEFAVAGDDQHIRRSDLQPRDVDRQ